MRKVKLNPGPQGAREWLISTFTLSKLAVPLHAVSGQSSV